MINTKFVSNKMRKIIPSASIELAAKVKKLKTTGKGVIDLTGGSQILIHRQI